MKTSIIKKYSKNIYYFLGIFAIIISWFLISEIVNNEGIIPSLASVFLKLKALLIL